MIIYLNKQINNKNKKTLHGKYQAWSRSTFTLCSETPSQLHVFDMFHKEMKKQEILNENQNWKKDKKLFNKKI